RLLEREQEPENSGRNRNYHPRDRRDHRQLVPDSIRNLGTRGEAQELTRRQGSNEGIPYMLMCWDFIDEWHDLPPCGYTMRPSSATAKPQTGPSAAASPPRAPRTRLATTRHRITMAKPINAFDRLLFADSSARTLPPAVMYWYPASMTKKAAAMAATAAPT